MSTTVDRPEPAGQDVAAGERGDLLLDDYFAPVPEWVLDAAISDCALRLYAVLLRYGQTSGARMPSRATLARRLRKGSADTVDRAMRELVALGAVDVERRRVGSVNQTNRYHLRTRSLPCVGGGRRDAATPAELTAAAAVEGTVGCHPMPVGDGTSDPAIEGGRRFAASGRTDAARVAAKMRPDPESLTQIKPTPPPTPARLLSFDDVAASGAELSLAAMTSLGDLSDLELNRAETLALTAGLPDAAALLAIADRCRNVRAAAGLAVGRWDTRCVLAAVQLAVQRAMPAQRIPTALLTVAIDPETRSPMRLAEAGPWWNHAATAVPRIRRTVQEENELAELESFLGEREDRAWLQSVARSQLTASGDPVDRLSVARRAQRLAEKQIQQQAQTLSPSAARAS